MDGNLILKINDSVLEKAMTYANQRGVNLSAVVEDFLFRLASGPNAKPSASGTFQEFERIAS